MKGEAMNAQDSGTIGVEETISIVITEWDEPVDGVRTGKITMDGKVIGWIEERISNEDND